MKRHSRIIPDPFVIGPSGNQTVDPRPTSRGNHQILSQKDPLQAVGLLLCLGAISHWCRPREKILLPCTASPTSDSSSQVRLPYACITGAFFGHSPKYFSHLDFLALCHFVSWLSKQIEAINGEHRSFCHAIDLWTCI